MTKEIIRYLIIKREKLLPLLLHILVSNSTPPSRLEHPGSPQPEPHYTPVALCSPPKSTRTSTPHLFFFILLISNFTSNTHQKTSHHHVRQRGARDLRGHRRRRLYDLPVSLIAHQDSVSSLAKRPQWQLFCPLVNKCILTPHSMQCSALRKNGHVVIKVRAMV